MYSVIYLYPVKLENKAKFVSINKQAGEIYVEYGALSDETFQPVHIDGKYNSIGLGENIELHENETLMFSIATFIDKGHHDEVLEKVDQDSRILSLFEDMKATIDITRIVRGEFERV
ncbi:DUF1428 family protein [Paenisporosarcina cavernae]|uniref:DUF1428 family protein n=1 Tax=Paenisporosarcina cavernae TaxID=2320858 RepID=A0A385YUH8_9BACL|nr:DUF1428 family protein [Paenisporosarcina cavernae]AYC30545.1 DUF1428 family protein [Paenisporosarcina cavernae]